MRAWQKYITEQQWTNKGQDIEEVQQAYYSSDSGGQHISKLGFCQMYELILFQLGIIWKVKK